eukprot:4524321-Ditylum_brightwellii.AAC.1
MEAQPICSWFAFHFYWKRRFPNIKVRKRGADTCTDCRMFLNSISFSPPQMNPTPPLDKEELENEVET